MRLERWRAAGLLGMVAGACAGDPMGIELLGDAPAAVSDVVTGDAAVYDTRLAPLDITGNVDTTQAGDAEVGHDAAPDGAVASDTVPDAADHDAVDDLGVAGDSAATSADATPPDAIAPDPVCGDGVRAGDEACDGGDLAGASCASLGFLGGDLGCHACAFATRSCWVEVFSRRFGGLGEDRITGLAVAPNGAVVVTGAVNAPIDLGGGALLAGAGNNDAFILGLTAAGGYRFGRRFMGSGNDLPTNVGVTPDGGAVVGLSVEGTFDFGTGPNTSPIPWQLALAGFNASGAPVWTRFVSGSGGMEVPTDLGTTAAGELVLLAFTSEISVDYGTGVLPGTGQVVLAKYDAAGAPMWARRVGPEASALVYDRMAVAPSGKLLISGRVARPVDFGGGVCAAENTVLASLDAAGGHVYTLCEQGEPRRSAHDGAGGAYVVHAEAQGAPPQVTLRRLDASGAERWRRTFGLGSPGGTLTVDAVASLPGGDAVIVGTTSGGLDLCGEDQAFQSDPLQGLYNFQGIYVVRYDADGGCRRGRVFEGLLTTPFDFFYDLGVVAAGGDDVFVRGTFSGSVSFGAVPLVAADDPATEVPDGRDGFIARLRLPR